MLKDKLGIDDKDTKILSLVMKNPDISQQTLAKELDLSQPSINVRMRKLKERGILVQTAGLDAKSAGVSLARVDFTCSNAEEVLGILNQCSFFVNGFIMSGTRNVSVFLVGEDLRKVEHIVNRYLRSSPQVSNIELSVVVNTTKEFVCSVDVQKERTEPCADPESCKECAIHTKLQMAMPASLTKR